MPGKDHDWCYYHQDDWESGEYTLKIESEEGRPWGELHFEFIWNDKFPFLLSISFSSMMLPLMLLPVGRFLIRFICQ
jgi:hypothetical protein